MAGEIQIGLGAYRDDEGNPIPAERVAAIRRAIERQQDEGPHLAIAVFCEQAIEGRDRLFSIVRAFDHLFLAPVAGREVFPATVQLRMHLSFRYTGKGRIMFVGIRQRNPDDTEEIVHSFGLGFPEGRTSYDEQVVRPFTFRHEGLHRFDILDERQQRVTQMPLWVGVAPIPEDQVPLAQPVRHGE